MKRFVAILSIGLLPWAAAQNSTVASRYNVDNATTYVDSTGSGSGRDMTLTSPLAGTVALADLAAATGSFHAAVTLAGALDYLTLTGQQITRGAIDLSTDVTGALSVANGGTGGTTAAAARANLGLLSMAQQASSAVTISGGSINGTAIGASTAAAIRGTTVTATTGLIGTLFSDGTVTEAIAFSGGDWSVNTDWVPVTDASFDLGTSALRFRDLRLSRSVYASDDAHIEDALTMGGNLTAGNSSAEDEHTLTGLTTINGVLRLPATGGPEPWGATVLQFGGDVGDVGNGAPIFVNAADYAPGGNVGAFVVNLWGPDSLMAVENTSGNDTGLLVQDRAGLLAYNTNPTLVLSAAQLSPPTAMGLNSDGNSDIDVADVGDGYADIHADYTGGVRVGYRSRALGLPVPTWFGGPTRWMETTSGAGDNYIALVAPAALDGNSTWTLPSDTPSDGQVLTWNTGATLSWETPVGGTEAQTLDDVLTLGNASVLPLHSGATSAPVAQIEVTGIDQTGAASDPVLMGMRVRGGDGGPGEGDFNVGGRGASIELAGGNGGAGYTDGDPSAGGPGGVIYLRPGAGGAGGSGGAAGAAGWVELAGETRAQGLFRADNGSLGSNGYATGAGEGYFEGDLESDASIYALTAVLSSGDLIAEDDLIAQDDGTILGQLGVGTASPGARLEIDTGASDATAALLLDQNDDDQPFIEFEGLRTSGGNVYTHADVDTIDTGSFWLVKVAVQDGTNSPVVGYIQVFPDVSFF